MYGHIVPSPIASHYWCAAPDGEDFDPGEFAKEYFSRIASQTSGSGPLSRLQLLAHRHFYGALPSGFIGDMPSAAEVTRAGEQGQNIELRVNWLRAHANAKHQIIVAPKLAWGCLAANTDSRSMADASRGGTILEALWKQGNYEQQAISAVLGMILYGEEFLFTHWSGTGGKQLEYNQESKQVRYEGDLECYQVLPWNAFRDATAATFEASPWRSVRIPRNRWDLIAQYPEFRDEILAAPQAPGTQTVNSQGIGVAISDPDKVLCHYFFHERRPALPVGLQAVLLSTDCVLQAEPLERCYWKSPIHRFSAGDLKGTPWSYTDFWEAMASQDLASDIQGSLATNIVTFGKQMISAEADQDLPVSQIGNGPMVLYRPKGSPVPQPIQLTAQSPDAFKHLANLKDDQRLALGLNDVAMGEAPTGTPNAQAWALLSTASITANSGAQRSWVEGVRSVGRSMLAIFKEKATVQRKTAVVGIHGASVPKQEEWDQSDFQGVDDVTIDIANPLSQTSAGRLQLAQLNMDAGFVSTPEQLSMVVETGSLQPMTQVLRDELIYIAWENEQILQGINPPIKLSDSHQMHIREHRGPTFSADGRTNPAVNAAGDEHTRQHLEMLLQMDPRTAAIFGQAAAPPAPMPAAPSSEEPGQQGAIQSPLADQQGPTADIKLPEAPTNPATGAQAAPPGIQ